MKVIKLDEIKEEGVSHDPSIRKKVLIRNGVVPNLTNFSQSRLKHGQKSTAHTHADMTEIYFVEQGNGLIRIDGADIKLEPGMCVVVEPGEEHAVNNNSGNELVLTYFGLTGSLKKS